MSDKQQKASRPTPPRVLVSDARLYEIVGTVKRIKALINDPQVPEGFNGMLADLGLDLIREALGPQGLKYAEACEIADAHLLVTASKKKH